MQGREITSEWLPVTLWAVRHHGSETQCVIDRPLSVLDGAASRGTALVFVDGKLSRSRTFLGPDELIALTSDWQLDLLRSMAEEQ